MSNRFWDVHPDPSNRPPFADPALKLWLREGAVPFEVVAVHRAEGKYGPQWFLRILVPFNAEGEYGGEYTLSIDRGETSRDSVIANIQAWLNNGGEPVTVQYRAVSLEDGRTFWALGASDGV